MNKMIVRNEPNLPGAAPGRATGWVARFPILLAVAVIGFAVLFAICIRVTEPLAISPWESAIAMDAMRMLAGVPVYSPSHATHLYGPLLTAALAGIFSVTGLNLLAARVVFCVIGLALPAALAYACAPRRNGPQFLAILGMGLAIEWRTNFIGLTAQPDAPAALLGMLALICWVKARSWPMTAASLLLFIGALLFKQTAVAMAVIPAVYVLLFERPVFSRRMLRALLPLAACALTLAAIYVLEPDMFHAMVTVPASLNIRLKRAFPEALRFFATFPVIFLIISSLLSGPALRGAERWSVAAMAALFPACFLAMLKSGGTYNSMMPAYLAMIALGGMRLEYFSDQCSTTTARAFVASCIIAIALLASFFFQFEQSAIILLSHCGDDKYSDAVEVARSLDSRVICPQDPTIPFRANGTFGRSLFFELDTHPERGEWPPELPDGLASEMRSAKFVMEADSYISAPQFDAALVSLGYHPMTVAQLEGSAYRLWSK